MVRGEVELLKVLERPAYTHFLGVLKPKQLGVGLFFAKLELCYFTPGTEKFNNFHYYQLGTADLSWGVASIPSVHRQFVEKVANEAGLQLAPNKYIETISINGKSISLENKNIFILVNEPNIIITGDVGGDDVVKKLFEAEANAINLIKKKFQNRI